MIREGALVAKPVIEVIHRGDLEIRKNGVRFWQALDRKSEHLLEGKQG